AEPRQPIVLTVSPTIIEADILTLDDTGFVETSTDDCNERRVDIGRTTAEQSDHRHRLLRARRARPRPRPAAARGDELATVLKKTRSHGTTAKRVGSAKRLRSAKDLPFSSSRVGRGPVRNSLDHLVGAAKQRQWHSKTERFRGLEVDVQLDLRGLLDRQV